MVCLLQQCTPISPIGNWIHSSPKLRKISHTVDIAWLKVTYYAKVIELPKYGSENPCTGSTLKVLLFDGLQLYSGASTVCVLHCHCGILTGTTS